MLTATAGVVLLLAFAGCGRDATVSDSGAQGAATATTDAVGGAAAGRASNTDAAAAKTGSKAAGAEKGAGSKGGGSRSSGSKRSAAGGAGSQGSASKGSAAKLPGAKKAAAGATGGQQAGDGASGDAAGETAAGGGAPRSDREEVFSVVRRYQQAFLDGDGAAACALLTPRGRREMISGGRRGTCAASVERVIELAKPEDLELVKTTREKLALADVAVKGDRATVAIGRGLELRLAQLGGDWRIDDPSP